MTGRAFCSLVIIMTLLHSAEAKEGNPLLSSSSVNDLTELGTKGRSDRFEVLRQKRLAVLRKIDEVYKTIRETDAELSQVREQAANKAVSFGLASEASPFFIEEDIEQLEIRRDTAQKNVDAREAILKKGGLSAEEMEFDRELIDLRAKVRSIDAEIRQAKFNAQKNEEIRKKQEELDRQYENERKKINEERAAEEKNLRQKILSFTETNL